MEKYLNSNKKSVMLDLNNFEVRLLILFKINIHWKDKLEGIKNLIEIFLSIPYICGNFMHYSCDKICTMIVSTTACMLIQHLFRAWKSLFPMLEHTIDTKCPNHSYVEIQFCSFYAGKEVSVCNLTWIFADVKQFIKIEKWKRLRRRDIACFYWP